MSWTPEQKDLLKRTWRTCTASGIAAAVGKSHQAVWKQAWRMGLTTKPKRVGGWRRKKHKSRLIAHRMASRRYKRRQRRLRRMLASVGLNPRTHVTRENVADLARMAAHGIRWRVYGDPAISKADVISECAVYILSQSMGKYCGLAIRNARGHVLNQWVRNRCAYARDRLAFERRARELIRRAGSGLLRNLPASLARLDDDHEHHRQRP